MFLDKLSRIIYMCVLGIYMFGATISCDVLKREAEKYIHKHFLKVSKEEEFLSLEKEYVIQFLQSECLHVENEYQVFKGWSILMFIIYCGASLWKLNLVIIMLVECMSMHGFCLTRFSYRPYNSWMNGFDLHCSNYHHITIANKIHLSLITIYLTSS